MAALSVWETDQPKSTYGAFFSIARLTIERVLSYKIIDHFIRAKHVDQARRAICDTMQSCDGVVKPKQHLNAFDDKMSPATNIVSWTFSNIHVDPDKPVLIDAASPDRLLTKRSALRLVAGLAGSFDKGSTVCLHMFNDITYPVLAMSINASQCRWTGTNTAYKAQELEHHFRISETRYVITTHEHLDVVHTAAQKSGTNPEIILFSDLLSDKPKSHAGAEIGQDGHRLRTLHDLMKPGDEASLHDALQAIDPDSIAALFSTSGTTGAPKMAARTHKALVLETQAIEDNNSDKDYKVRRLYCTPIFHAFSTPEMMYNALRLGQISFFMRRFDLATWPRSVHVFGITETFAPPAMIALLADTEAAHPHIQSLRAVYTGGAPLASSSAERFRAAVKEPLRIVQVWGMTEGGWFATFKYPEDDRSASVGRAVPGYEIRLSDDHRSQLEDGTTVGEIYVKGPSLMRCYFGNKEGTDDAFEQGWLKTGDIGYIQGGKVFLIDRAKDLIKIKGWQVSPTEIEARLAMAIDMVQDSAVVGSGFGSDEHAIAFVVRKHSRVTEKMIKDHLLGGLTRYKAQDCEVKFVDSIPRSTAGKILKKDLRKLVGEQQQTQ